MQENSVIINRIPTRILTWGKNIKDTFDPDENLILVIPGNPGVTKFYVDFLDELHKLTKIPIWIISHAGHEIVRSEGHPNRKGNEVLYSLEGQVKHKERFIEDYVLPKGIDFYLIGHSIGSYIIVELLENPNIKSRILHNYLLFPTIEYMAETSNGRFIMNFLRPLQFLLFPLVYLLYYILPMFIKIFVVSIYMKLVGIPDKFCDVVVEFFHPYTVVNFAAMGMDEMYKVRERNNGILRDNVGTITMYYGTTDRWVPISYYEKIREDIPGINAIMCDSNYKHAFVLRDSIPMAQLVNEWIIKSKGN